MIEEPILFNEIDLNAFVENKRHEVDLAVERYEPKELLGRGVAELAQIIVATLRVEVPQIEERGIYLTESESHRGTVLKFHVPYTGGGDLFRVFPSRHSPTDPPRGVAQSGELIMTVLATGYDGKAVRHAIDREIAKVKEWLRLMQQDVDGLNASLVAQAENEIESRREQLSKAEQMARDIGYPKR
jgi:hypothetical protein